MYEYETQYDVIVVGAGHAGCEAALAASRLGMKTALFSMNLDTVAQMSCNPAIGGLAKGHLVREIDALGGQMGINADQAGIQFKMLNTSKGPAVWSLRSQSDKYLYKTLMRRTLEEQPLLELKQGEIVRLIDNGDRVQGVESSAGVCYRTRAIVLTTGTFLGGLIHIGLKKQPGGRAGEFPAEGLSDDLAKREFRVGRLKTGTPPRIDARTIDLAEMEAQAGDPEPQMFSILSREPALPQRCCYRAYTNENTHRIIRENLDRSPLYAGEIRGIGPRYCPSIEDKVVRFADKDRHQIFLEPEGLETREFYANGISTSLPMDVQFAIVRSVRGMESAEIMRPGYAVEYDFVDPRELKASLETKRLRNLFNAGQINGTSGYEEAAAQGLIAGINAARSIQGKEAVVLKRSQAYIGVLIDDLITRGAPEPYRMFTSRAEYRLLLRQDNAEERLTPLAMEIGLAAPDRVQCFESLYGEVCSIGDFLGQARHGVDGIDLGSLAENIPLGTSFEKMLCRPGVALEDLLRLGGKPGLFSREAIRRAEIRVKYKGYVKRQLEMAARFEKSEEKTIPPDLDYRSLGGLSTEVLQKLESVRPSSLGQAGRIPGVTPAALSLILVALERKSRGRKEAGEKSPPAAKKEIRGAGRE